MPVTEKKFKELLTPAQNGIAASVGCVSSTPAVLNTRFERLVAGQADKRSR